MNSVNQQIQNLTLVDFANMFKMTKDGSFATSVEGTNGRIYADKNGLVHNVNHAHATGKGDAAANLRLREQLIAAFAKGNATQNFLIKARDTLGLGWTRTAERQRPLDRRVVKQLLQEFRAGEFDISDDDVFHAQYASTAVSMKPISSKEVEKRAGALNLSKWEVFDSAPNVVQAHMDLHTASLEDAIANLLDMDELSKVPKEMKDGQCRAILKTCLRQIVESFLAERGSLAGFCLSADPAFRALDSILKNEDLGFKTLVMANSLPPREATAFLRAVALVPHVEYGLDMSFFAAAPELARLPLSQFTVGNVLRLARPEFVITEDVKYSAKPPTKEQFEKICQPLNELYEKLNGLTQKASYSNDKKSEKRKGKYIALTNLFLINGAAVKDVKACLKNFNAFNFSMIPKLALKSVYYARPKPLTTTLDNLYDDLTRNKPKIDVLDKHGQISSQYNGEGMKKDALKGLGDDVAKLCGSENLLQQQMVLLAMSQNALMGESGLSRFWGNGDELPLGMQFVLKRDEKTGDVLLSRQTPPNVGFGYSMTLRIRPDGSQTVAYLEASHAGHVSGLLDEKGFPLRMDSDITSGKPSTKEEVAKAKTYVAGWQKLLTQIQNLRDDYSNAFSKNLACALSKFDSSENRQFLVQFAKHLEKPGVDAQYVRSQISNRFNLVASRMEESEYNAFNGFLSAVMNVKPQKFIDEYYDTAELDVLVDKKGLQDDIGRLVDQDAFPDDLYALQSVIKDIGLEIHRKRLEADRIEPQDASQQQVQSQPAVEEQEQPKKAEPSDKDEEIIEDDPVEIVRDKGIRNSEINLNRSDIIRENIDFGLEDDEVIFRE